MFYVTSLPLTAFVVVAAMTSMASGAVVLGFAYTKESVPVQFLGTISGVINMGNMIARWCFSQASAGSLTARRAGRLRMGFAFMDPAGFSRHSCWSSPGSAFRAC